MSHIAEGLLHAHLDGALEPAERERWADAEAHLAVCEDCRRRLEEAREIRDEAAALLAGASAPAAERPSFDALVTEAGRRRTEVSEVDRSRYVPSRRWWSSPVKLAWAASLILAVGAGWIGRQLLVEEGGDVPLLMESRAAPERPGPAELVEPREAGALEEAATTDDGAAGGRTEPPPPAQENDRDRRADAAREAPAKAAEPGGGEEAAADVAAADEAVREERESVALAPQALARRVPAAACYGLEPPEGPAGVLRLRADDTAALSGDGRPLVGFWERPSADSVVARLTDGEGWIELRLGSDDLERSERDCPVD